MGLVGLGGWSRPIGDAEVTALLCASDAAIMTQVDDFLVEGDKLDPAARPTMSISALARRVASNQHEEHEPGPKRARG